MPTAEAFERFLARVAEGMPDEECVASITTTLRGRWDKPPMALLEQVLRRALSIEEARRVIFFPEPTDMADYTTAFSPLPAGCPPTHPRAKIQPLLLGVLYMSHRHDPTPMRAWVVRYGGLRALVGLLASDDDYVLSQALETLHALTALFDWHAEPADAPLLQPMADLAAPDVGLIAKLGGLYESRLPGCSMRALVVLAFWLGLLRYFFCKRRVLRLGDDVLALLRRWSERTDGEAEEVALARQLYADFSRFPLGGGGGGGGGGRTDEDEDEDEGELTAARQANLKLDAGLATLQIADDDADGAPAGAMAAAPAADAAAGCEAGGWREPADCDPMPAEKMAAAEDDAALLAAGWRSEVLDDLD